MLMVVEEGEMSLGLGLLIVRVLFGTAIAAHGAQKLFGWSGETFPKRCRGAALPGGANIKGGTYSND